MFSTFDCSTRNDAVGWSFGIHVRFGVSSQQQRLRILPFALDDGLNSVLYVKYKHERSVRGCEPESVSNCPAF